MSLLIGYAQETITPSLERPVYLAGFGQNRRAKSIHDDLYARALALRRGDLCVVLAALDLIGLPRQHCQEIEEGLDATAPGARLFLACTHTHHGPDTIGLWGPDMATSGVDPKYLTSLKEKIVSVASAALSKLQPADLSCTSVQVTGLAKNARDPDILDQELTCLQFCHPETGAALATWLTYPCHPEVLWQDNPYMTSDYVDSLRRVVETETGAPCLVTVGAIGGMMTPDVEEHSFAEAKQMGDTLAHAALDALSGAQAAPVERLQHSRHEFTVPMTNPLFRMAMEAGLLPDLLNDDGTISTEANLLKLGPVWILGVPGELLPKLGLAFKGEMRQAGAELAAVVGLTNDELGYILPQDDFIYPEDPLEPGDHYEETMSIGSEAGSRLRAALHALIERLPTVFSQTHFNIRAKEIFMSKLAILGGEPVRTEPYPPWPVFDERDEKAVTDVVKSGNWGGFPYPGPKTSEFLRRFLELQGGEHAVAMANGTVTMEVACRAADIGWGDEVIIPAYTFQATAAAPMAAGAIPVIVDIDPNTYCIDPKAIEAAITDKTRAVIPVHLGAQMADMDAIMEIAGRHDLIVIEDSAHAHGAKWRGQGAGTIGHFGSFSLQSSKILTVGEGGVLLCRTAELAARAASIIDCGRPHDEAGQRFTLGANYRMAELQAALGIVALERFPEQAKQREETAAYIDEALSEIPGVRILKRDLRHTTRSFYRYVFAIDPEVFGLEHNAVCYALHKEGIPGWMGYEAMHHYDLFQPQLSKLPVPSAFPERFQFDGMHLPEAERASKREAVWLDEAIFRAGRQGADDVVTALRKIYDNRAELAAKADELRTLLSS